MHWMEFSLFSLHAVYGKDWKKNALLGNTSTTSAVSPLNFAVMFLEFYLKSKKISIQISWAWCTAVSKGWLNCNSAIIQSRLLDTYEIMTNTFTIAYKDMKSHSDRILDSFSVLRMSNSSFCFDKSDQYCSTRHSQWFTRWYIIGTCKWG